MIVYSDRKREITPSQRIVELAKQAAQSHISRDSATELLFDLGDIECAAADACLVAAEHLLDRAMRAAAHVYLGRSDRSLEVVRAVAGIRPEMLPHSASVSISEGFAFYGLYPEVYAEATEQFVGEHRPQTAVVIGIRTIGTTLSAVVAAALEQHGCAVTRITVRPQGHPFDRHLELPTAAVDVIRSAAAAWIAIVDEGPGLSGSSFSSTVEALLKTGISGDRILIFPSWNPDPSLLRSAQARGTWTRHPRYTSSFRPSKHTRILREDLRDISAGQWRRYAKLLDAWPAVQPHHERRKYLIGDHGRPALAKFSGLGTYGQLPFHIATDLAEAGFCPAVHASSDGFLVTDFVEGVPMSREDATPEFVEHVAGYL